MAGVFSSYYEHEKVIVVFNSVNLFVCKKNISLCLTYVVVFTNHYSLETLITLNKSMWSIEIFTENYFFSIYYVSLVFILLLLLLFCWIVIRQYHFCMAKRIKLNLFFKLSCLSSNFALTQGYLNPASNNPAQCLTPGEGVTQYKSMCVAPRGGGTFVQIYAAILLSL